MLSPDGDAARTPLQTVNFPIAYCLLPIAPFLTANCELYNQGRGKENRKNMANREGFTSGLMIGATLGGLVGGVLGVVLASRLSQEESSAEPLPETKRKRIKAMPFREANNMETARLSLEDKIAQLNQAIDDVRQQLGTVNGNGVSEPREQSFSEDV